MRPLKQVNLDMRHSFAYLSHLYSCKQNYNNHCLPICSACLMRKSAARSFTEPPGLSCSAFTSILQPVSSLIRFNLINGVLEGERIQFIFLANSSRCIVANSSFHEEGAKNTETEGIMSTTELLHCYYLT